MDRLAVFKRASLCYHFEEKVYQMIQEKKITVPTYLSSGQDLIPSTIAQILQENDIKPLIFCQHRNHSIYLAFGGDPSKLIRKLLGIEDPMEGSASIQCKEINMYGHDGLLGSQVPISAGACLASKKPTICFLGDASCEEDYVLSSLGFAATKNLPILFVVDDNNLSILTEKKVRRSWDIHTVAQAFGMMAYNIKDDPYQIEKVSVGFCKSPMLINVNTHRKYWHCGSGKDGETFERYKEEMKFIGKQAELFDKNMKEYVEELWDKELLK